MDGTTQIFMLCATAALNIAVTTLLIEEEQRQTANKVLKRSVWVEDWLEQRKINGCFWKLIEEFRSKPKLFRNFFRMSVEDFDFLLSLVSPYITKQDTVMREAIPPGERLAVTLRFLASGDSFKSLSYLFRIPQCTITKIVPEVLDAIYAVLEYDYLKVSYFVFYFHTKNCMCRFFLSTDAVYAR